MCVSTSAKYEDYIIVFYACMCMQTFTGFTLFKKLYRSGAPELGVRTVMEKLFPETFSPRTFAILNGGGKKIGIIKIIESAQRSKISIFP